MDLSLTQSQEMLRTAAREMVEREYSKETLLRLESGDRELGQSLWDKTASQRAGRAFWFRRNTAVKVAR